MNNLTFMPHQQKALDLTEDKNRVAYYLDFVGAEKVYLLNNDVNLVICQKSKMDDWVEYFNTYYPDYVEMASSRRMSPGAASLPVWGV